MDKVVRDGKVAVLYSPGFGAGWFSWNKRFKECLFHPKIVELVANKSHDKITDELCKELFGDEFYSGGSHGLRIQWVPVSMQFRVCEYDGSEYLEFRDSDIWEMA